MAEVKRSMSLASIEHGLPEASQDAWTYYLSCLDEARARLLSSVWATGPTERAQAQYCIQMLAAFGFNIYCAPRQAYPNFYLQTIFLPFEYGFGLPCPDFHYRWTFLDGARDYRIHGRLGKSRWIEFQAQRGFWGDENQSRLGNWDFDDFEVAADGSFEIVASPRKQKANWIELDPACGNITLMARDALYDWNSDVPMEVHIEHLGRGTGWPRCAWRRRHVAPAACRRAAGEVQCRLLPGSQCVDRAGGRRAQPLHVAAHAVDEQRGR